jgi:hypothetical protein
MPSRSDQSSHDPDNFSRNSEEYLSANNMVKRTPERSNRTACLLTAARLYLNSLPDLPQNWGQINLTHNDHHSDSMEISSTFWNPDITDWWRQLEGTCSKYADLANVACNVFSIIPPASGVEASFTIG